jgi:hypothetical protein
MKIRRYKDKWLLARERPDEKGQPLLNNSFDTKEEAEQHIQLVSVIQAMDQIQERLNEVRRFLKNLQKPGHTYESELL